MHSESEVNYSGAPPPPSPTNPASQSRYLPFGEERWTNGFTGQRKAGFGLLDYKARFYDARLGRFISPDSVVPNPGNVLDWDRYQYVRGNPLRYSDPSGHDPIPYDEFIKQAVDFFGQKGWALVGTVQGLLDKGINTNGADIVFQQVTKVTENGIVKEVTNVLGVELKNIKGNVNISTLGKNRAGDYGGSIEGIIISASRFINSSNQQLRTECRAIGEAYQSGTLQNALYTTADKVSDKASKVFKDVYTGIKNNAVPASTLIQTGAQALGSFVSSTWTTFGGIFYYNPQFLYPYPTKET